MPHSPVGPDWRVIARVPFRSARPSARVRVKRAAMQWAVGGMKILLRSPRRPGRGQLVLAPRFILLLSLLLLSLVLTLGEP